MDVAFNGFEPPGGALLAGVLKMSTALALLVVYYVYVRDAWVPGVPVVEIPMVQVC